MWVREIRVVNGRLIPRRLLERGMMHSMRTPRRLKKSRVGH